MFNLLDKDRRGRIKLLTCLVILIAFSWIAFAQHSTVQAHESSKSFRSVEPSIEGNTINASLNFDCATVTGIPTTECTALLHLFDDTDGPNWKNQSGWLVTNTPCTWYGITCELNHVVKIQLLDNLLLGTIPPELGTVEKLVSLNLGKNQLSGAIPPELAEIDTLQDIQLWGNNLSGSIPQELGSLSRLKALTIYGNNLEGNLPDELQNLTSLVHLLVYKNNLTGEIPGWLGKLGNLKNLRLDDNQFTGPIPSELAQLKSLEVLRLHNNLLTDSIPDIWGEMSSLTVLTIQHNRALRGTLPESICSLDALGFLAMGSTDISGPLPLCLKDLIILNDLRFDQTEICIPDNKEFLDWLDGIATVFGDRTLCQGHYTLVLIYAVLDNNLESQWATLMNNVEAGIHDDVKVRMLIDGGKDVITVTQTLASNAYIYDVIPDSIGLCPNRENPTCDNRYILGENFQVANEDTAHPDNLFNFIKEGIEAYPNATPIHLVLVGHGSGWGANVLPSSPVTYNDQNGNEIFDEMGGMLWDDNTGDSEAALHAMSTQALGVALQSATEATGRQIDLLYLDGCSMAMAEVAYEVHNSANYLLASPNIDWASFGYRDLLAATNPSVDGKELGQTWLPMIAQALRKNPGHPFTISLTDLSQMEQLAASATKLADVVFEKISTHHVEITNAFSTTELFDSNYDYTIDLKDSYADFLSFTDALAQEITDDELLIEAIDRVQQVLGQAILMEDHESGNAWLKPDDEWRWGTLGGLSIYLPFGNNISSIDLAKLLLYNETNLAWARDTSWDELIQEYIAIGNVESARLKPTELPRCTSTDECDGLAQPLSEIESMLFLPFINLQFLPNQGCELPDCVGRPPLPEQPIKQSLVNSG